MVNLWMFIMLGLVLLPCGVLALLVWQTWTVGNHPVESKPEQEHHTLP